MLVTNQSGGTVEFSGAITDTGAGIDLQNNTGATISFTGGLDIDTTTGTGFNATGGGTVSVTNGVVTNSVTSTAGTAVNLDGVTIGAAGMSFTDISAIGGTNGVRASMVDGGVFTSGVTTVNTTTGDGISITGSAATFTFNGVTTVAGSGDAGIALSGANGPITFASVDIDSSTGRGIEMIGVTGNVTISGGSVDDGAATTGSGLHVEDQAAGSTIALNGVDITSDQDTADAVSIQNAMGTITMTGGTITQTGGHDAVDVTGGAAAITVGSAIVQTGTSAAASNAVEIADVTGGSASFTGAVTHTGPGSAVEIQNNTGGVFGFDGLVTANTGAGTGIDLLNNAGATTSFTGGLDIDTTTGTGFNATGGGTVSVTNGVATNTITTTNGTALVLDGVAIGGTGITFNSIASTDAATDGITLDDVTGGTLSVTGTTTITNPGDAGIDILGTNTATFTFADVDISLGTAADTRGINFAGTSSAVSFGATTITGVGSGATQVGLDFNGATLNGTVGFTSAAISGPATSTDSIGIDLTGVLGNQTVTIGEQVVAGASSAITDLHRGVVIDPTAAVQFTFGDGEGATDTRSSINVNGLAGSFLIDAVNGTLAASSFNFEDVAFGAGDEFNFPFAPDAPVFVSEAGGRIAAGVNNVSIALNTVTVAEAEALVDTDQTFVFVGDAGGLLNLLGGGADGFTLDAGQSIDGFADGNVIATGLLLPGNITGDFSSISTMVTADAVTARNSTAGATGIISSALSGGHRVENFNTDATGLGAGSAALDITGATAATTVNNIEISNLGGGADGVHISGSDVAISDLMIAGTGGATGDGIEILDGGQAIVVSLNNVTVSDAGANALRIDGSGAGSVTVNGAGNNQSDI